MAEQRGFVKGLRLALKKEEATQRTYLALARRESSETRRHVLEGLAATEATHAERWTKRLVELGEVVAPYRDSLWDGIWRWILVQSGTDNALKRLEAAEDADIAMYDNLTQVAPTDTDRKVI